jgi:hypothetical protein
MMKVEEIFVLPSAPLSNAVTEILCSVSEYESGVCVDVYESVHRNTIMKVTSKK